MIPKIFHFAWFGPHKIPKKFLEYRETWRKSNPDWQVWTWKEDNIPKLRNQYEFDHAETYAEKKDIFSYECLYTHGGLFIDYDYECLKPIDRVLHDYNHNPLDLIICKEADNRKTEYNNQTYRQWFNNGLIGAIPEHPLIKRLINGIPGRARAWHRLPDEVKQRAECPTCWRAGPNYLTEMLENESFFVHEPRIWNRVYAQHHYANTWRRQRGISTKTGKEIIINYIKEHVKKNTKILDVGFGAGTYGKLLKKEGYNNIDGVDAYGGDMAGLHLEDVYQNIYIKDIYEFQFKFYDLIIMGDVLEHLTLKQSKELLKQFLKSKCTHLLISVPYNFHQGPSAHNQYDEHKQPHITREYMEQNFPYLKRLYEAQMEDFTGIISIWKNK